MDRGRMSRITMRRNESVANWIDPETRIPVLVWTTTNLNKFLIVDLEDVEVTRPAYHKMHLVRMSKNVRGLVFE